MNKKQLYWTLIIASTFSVSVASGQSSEGEPARPVELLTKSDSSREQIRLSYRMGFNISARIKNLANTSTFPAPPPPPPGAGPFVSATGNTYQDGYVGVDSSGNLLGYSEYWGYARSDQIIGNNLLLHHSASGTLFNDIDNAPQHGLEVTYARRLGECDWCKWGLEGGVNYMDLDFRTRGAGAQLVSVDAFAFPTDPGTGKPVIPPAAPFIGTYTGGRHALIQVPPTPYPAEVVSEFDPAVFGLKLGPYLELPLAKRISFNLSGGFALLFADGDFVVRQSVNIPGLGTSTSRITKSDLAVLPGGYLAGSLSWAVSDSINLFTALQYQYNGRYGHDAGDKRVEIDFRNSLYVSVGFSHAF